MHKLLLAISLCLGGHTLIWFQVNGQFLWPWFKRNPMILAIGMGSIISYLFILATSIHMNILMAYYGLAVLLGFGLGMVAYAVLTSYFMREGINLKTLTSLILSTGIICVQLFWK